MVSKPRWLHDKLSSLFDPEQLINDNINESVFAGLALWGNGQLEQAQAQLEQAAHLLESIRRETRGSSDYKLSLFDLQTASYQALQVRINNFTEAISKLLCSLNSISTVVLFAGTKQDTFSPK